MLMLRTRTDVAAIRCQQVFPLGDATTVLETASTTTTAYWILLPDNCHFSKDVEEMVQSLGLCNGLSLNQHWISVFLVLNQRNQSALSIGVASSWKVPTPQGKVCALAAQVGKVLSATCHSTGISVELYWVHSYTHVFLSSTKCLVPK